MAVKKPLRIRKHTLAVGAMRVLKSFRANWRSGSVGVSAAIALVALVAVFAFAYSASAPSEKTGEQRASAGSTQREATRGAKPVTAVRKETSAGDVSLASDADLEATGFVGPVPEVVTLTGCLERSDKQLRLSDTSGTKAPRSRSWKSGFLTKRSASVIVLPASNRMDLSKHLGHRVTVTGPLIDREMRVRTLRRVSPCGNGSRETA
jgi:hypothetical protein